MKEIDHKNKRIRIELSDKRFCEEFLALEDWLKLDAAWVFRGQASINWTLTNTLERKYKARELGEFNTISPKMTAKDGLTDFFVEFRRSHHELLGIH